MEPLPQTRLSTKMLLDAYTELRERLNGKCSDKSNTCPAIIVRFAMTDDFRDSLHITLRGQCKYNSRLQNKDIVFCNFCMNSFNVLEENCCPCQSKEVQSKQTFIRLDEVIEELQTKLRKEYSS